MSSSQCSESDSEQLLSGSDGGSEDSDSLSPGIKRKLSKMLKIKKAKRSMLHAENSDDDFDGHPESEQLKFAGLNIEPSSRRLAASKEAHKTPSSRGKPQKNGVGLAPPAVAEAKLRITAVRHFCLTLWIATLSIGSMVLNPAIATELALGSLGGLCFSAYYTS